VGLGDLFDVRSKDPSEFRIYRNKIDRKHARRVSSYVIQKPFAPWQASSWTINPTKGATARPGMSS
jgi:hypothetical protein